MQCHLEMQFSMGKTLNKHFKTFQDIFTQKWKKKQCLWCGSLPNLTGGRLTRLPILGKSWELNRIYPEFLFVYLMWQFFIKIILMFFSGHLPDGLKFMFRSYLRKSEICLHIVRWKGFMIFEVSRLISVLSLVRKVVVSPSIYPHLAKSLLLAVSKWKKRIQLSKKKKQKSHQKTKDIYCFIWLKGLISIALNSKSETRTWELIQYRIKYRNQTESRSKNLKTRALQQLVTPAAAAAVFLENVIFTLWEIIKMIFFILQWENCNIGNKHI